ncbi:Transcription factor TFIIB repeat, putative [Angomonas deanei]|uniref:Transcription factor TFIIB repeat, putative n=1 Tax=Angomonas deanei TaxID=59799 RepID=A0A7G2CDR4_9TRYP|nr:Transcription factor TFIIB repeat, putative [Angomonas deanei]
MSACSHPTSALFKDKDSNITHCTLCGVVVFDEQYEMDPVFANAAAGTNTRVNYRPTHGNITSTVNSSKPSIEAARRGLHGIARRLEISDDIVEIALGIYKLAHNINVISGARSAILCACLYIATRLERTAHIISDFCEVNNDDTRIVLAYVRHICKGTHTKIPVVDPAYMVQRFASLMDLGDKLNDIIICALKVLRIMKEDWISSGRRPMGVCVSALLVACYMFNVPRGPDQVCGMVRLTANTITKRLNEFASLPAALLERIDDYHHDNSTLPPAFNESSMRSTEEDVNADMRAFARVYYELVSEAKMSEPATEERCEKWRWFIQKHCEIEGKTPTTESLNLAGISAEEQLHILGLKNAKPIPRDRVEESLKEEEEKLIIKKEMTELSQLPPDASLDDPDTVQRMTEQYKELLENPAVKDIGNEFDFGEEQDSAPKASVSHRSASRAFSQREEGSMLQSALEDPDERKEVMQELLHDPTRRFAAPWEILVLQSAEEENYGDILQYIITDNEARLRRFKVGEQLHGERWNRGRARTEEELRQLEENRRFKRARHADPVKEATSVPNALERALRSRGGLGVIDVSSINELLPGLGADDMQEENTEWEL